MKGTFVAALLLVAVAAPVAPAFGLPTEEKSRWIVGFHEMPELGNGDSYEGAEVVSVTPVLRFATVEVSDVASFRARTMLDENVRYVESDVSDHVLHFTPNDFYWNHASNWGVKKIGAEAAWDRTLGSTAVKDGHVDSGLFRAHEDFTPASRFLAGRDFYQGDLDPQDESGCSWHGSHTSGTVGATIDNAKGFPGLAQATILPVKIFGGASCFAASVTNLANALRYVGDQGAHVSSNSWGGGSFSTAIDDAIAYSTNLGTIFVASAGNSACSNCIGNPWVSQESVVLIVTATDSNDAGASFNSKGPQVDVSAPGVDIGSAGGPNANSYYIMSGTSMAAPHVTGLVALIKTLNPTWTRAQVTDKITSTAVDLGAAGKDDTFGWGRINADAATAGGTPPPAQCADGVDNDGDSLIDYPADPGCASATDNDETDAPPAQNMHVSAMAASFTHSGNKHNVKCDVTIVDAASAAVSGASVTVRWTKPNGSTATGSATTSASGVAAITLSNQNKHGTYTCEVTNVAKSGWTYDSAANVVTSASVNVT